MKMELKYLSFAFLLLPISVYSHASDDDNERKFEVEFTSLNGSGVYAKAEIELKGNRKIKIKIEASGLESGKPHPQHIHGLDKPVRTATCPDISADTNADGLISVAEGLPSYGPIVLPLVPFNLVDENGELDYEVTYTITPGSVQPLQKRVIILHGMTVNGEYIPSLPIACGVIEQEEDS